MQDYIKRMAERKFLKMNDFFKVVLVTGARQVGKTTMLRHLAASDRTYVSLDNPLARDLAKNDPLLFFQQYKPPILIDEVQYAPELFPIIKLLADESEAKGQFWLTGSQQFQMMKHVQESLAGRIGLMQLYSLTTNEKKQRDFPKELNFSLASLLERQKLVEKNDLETLFQQIWLGGLPQALEADQSMRAQYFDAYVNTYLMRDVMELGGITDTLAFAKFLIACAALVGQTLSYHTLAEAADVDQRKAKEWLQLLVGLGIIYLLQPFSNNELKRLSKTPKLYFTDTGLASYLTRWLTSETLMNGAASGHFFENYVVMELVKNSAYSKEQARFTYYRDANQKEIDLFIERGRTIHPLEIKKSAQPKSVTVKKFSLLEKTGLDVGPGGIICMAPEVTAIDEKNCYIPANLI